MAWLAAAESLSFALKACFRGKAHCSERTACSSGGAAAAAEASPFPAQEPMAHLPLQPTNAAAEQQHGQSQEQAAPTQQQEQQHAPPSLGGDHRSAASAAATRLGCSSLSEEHERGVLVPSELVDCDAHQRACSSNACPHAASSQSAPLLGVSALGNAQRPPVPHQHLGAIALAAGGSAEREAAPERWISLPTEEEGDEGDAEAPVLLDSPAAAPAREQALMMGMCWADWQAAEGIAVHVLSGSDPLGQHMHTQHVASMSQQVPTLCHFARSRSLRHKPKLAPDSVERSTAGSHAFSGGHSTQEHTSTPRTTTGRGSGASDYVLNRWELLAGPFPAFHSISGSGSGTARPGPAPRPPSLPGPKRNVSTSSASIPSLCALAPARASFE